MLKRLYIKDFALIDELDASFGEGFSVITGETGAGKSILLGAIGLLTGQRADQRSIKEGRNKCIVEAVFSIGNQDIRPLFEANDIEYDQEECIVRREVSSSGKSRAFINDTPVQLSVLRELGGNLIDIHSQNQNMLLSSQAFRLSVVDIIAGTKDELKLFSRLYDELKARKQALEKLRQDIENNERERDLILFQFNELDASSLSDGEQEELEAKASLMSHAEEIKRALFEADNNLNGDETSSSSSGQQGAIILLSKSTGSLRYIEKIMPFAGEMAQRIESCMIELRDISSEVASEMEKIEFEPSLLDSINQRLDLIYMLQKKYKRDSVAGLISLRNSLEARLSMASEGREKLADMEKEIKELEEDAWHKALIIRKKRKEASKKVDGGISAILANLGMKGACFETLIEECPLGRDGADKVSFLFSANRNVSPQPAEKIASGGETARLMLSLKSIISGISGLPTIIFDEIDTGVSGAIASKMGQIMREMGDKGTQVISITHLPQIAALGSLHYKVSKIDSPSGASSRLDMLSPDERILEIAAMLSDGVVSQSAMSNAKDLLNPQNHECYDKNNPK